jgi:hypothetical protein
LKGVGDFKKLGAFAEVTGYLVALEKCELNII